jgi:hypothetical protein
MILEDFIDCIQEQKIDFSRGHIFSFYKRKKYIVSAINWEFFNERKILRIYLECEVLSKSNPQKLNKPIIKILQDLLILKDFINKFKETSNNVYLKINDFSFIIKNIKHRKEHIILIS